MPPNNGDSGYTLHLRGPLTQHYLAMAMDFFKNNVMASTPNGEVYITIGTRQRSTAVHMRRVCGFAPVFL